MSKILPEPAEYGPALCVGIPACTNIINHFLFWNLKYTIRDGGRGKHRAINIYSSHCLHRLHVQTVYTVHTARIVYIVYAACTVYAVYTTYTTDTANIAFTVHTAYLHCFNSFGANKAFLPIYIQYG